MRWSRKSKLLTGFCSVLLLLAINATVSYYNTQHLLNHNQSVTHSYQVLSELESIVSMVKDVEIGTRGFVITGDNAYLEPYYAGVKRTEGHLQPLNALVNDNTAQKSRVAVLEVHIRFKLANSKKVIELRRKSGLEAAAKFVADGQGEREMDEIRTTVSNMKAEENRLLDTRSAQTADKARVMLLTLVLGGISSVILLSVVFYALARAQVQKDELSLTFRELERQVGLRENLTEMLVHDLRTPLTTLLGPLELLQDDSFGKLDDLQKEMVTMSTQSGYRLLELINELLDIAKMEAGEMQVRREPIQIPNMIDSAIKQVKGVNQSDSATISIEIQPELPTFNADEPLVSRVLVNLLGNAMKFTPARGMVTVGVRLVNSEDREMGDWQIHSQSEQLAESSSVIDKIVKHYILFFVKDTGEGIPIAEQQRIFQRFGQVDTSEANKKLSTGLGLTFCKLAVAAHGGHIWVSSEPGKGSTFFFALPINA